MMSDSFLFNAGSVFFAFWSLIVAAVGAAAFGRDLFPPRKLISTQQAKRPPIRPRNHLPAEAKMTPK